MIKIPKESLAGERTTSGEGAAVELQARSQTGAFQTTEGTTSQAGAVAAITTEAMSQNPATRRVLPCPACPDQQLARADRRLMEGVGTGLAGRSPAPKGCERFVHLVTTVLEGGATAGRPWGACLRISKWQGITLAVVRQTHSRRQTKLAIAALLRSS